MARNYRKEYDEYHAKSEQKKRRAGRNKARRTLMRNGKVSKGDGKDVHHKDHNPRNNSSKNLSVMSSSKNKSMQSKKKKKKK